MRTLSYNNSDYGFWIRIKNFVVQFKTSNSFRLFSERNGYKKSIKIGKYELFVTKE